MRPHLRNAGPRDYNRELPRVRIGCARKTPEHSGRTHEWQPVRLADFVRLPAQRRPTLQPRMLPIVVEPLQVATATAQQQPVVFSLLLRHLPETERQQQCREFLDAAASGEITLDGLLGAWRQQHHLGSIFYSVRPDKTAFVWPAVAVDDAAVSATVVEVEDALMGEVCRRLDAAQAWLGQSIQHRGNRVERAILSRNGFEHLVDLEFLVRDLPSPPVLVAEGSFRVETFKPGANDAQFAAALEQTYINTRDCPELNGTRTASEALASHSTSDGFDPAHFTLYKLGDEVVGVVFLAYHRVDQMWEVVYMGLVPRWRGRGFGKQILHLALAQALREREYPAYLSVDSRNTYAVEIYRQLGFRHAESRSVHARLHPERRAGK